MKKTIEVRAARTQQDVLDHECDVVFTFDTIAEAKAKAQYYLTDDYQRASEMSQPLGYAQVVVNGDCLYDFWRKEPKAKATQNVFPAGRWTSTPVTGGAL